jgi:hypothetical protein
MRPMGTNQATGGDVENPAAIADAEQHARQDIAGRSARLTARLSRDAAPLAAGAGVLLSGWLILRRLRRR